MANVNVDLKNAANVKKIRKFRGVDEGVVISEDGYAEKCVNFRVMKDNTLKRRCGFRRQGNLPYAVRTFWDGYVSGTRYCFALAGQYIYNVNFYSNTYTNVGMVATTSGKAEFFLYAGTLYLTDGESVYMYTSGYFTKTMAYIPLYGNGWSPFNRGEVNEKMNLLTPYIRVSYTMSSDTDTTYSFDFEPESVYKLYINGVSYPTSHFKFGTTNHTGTLLTAGVKRGNEVLIYFKLANFQSNYPAASSVISSTGTVVHGLSDFNRLFLYGGTKKRRIFRSRGVDDSAFAVLKAQEALSSELYFTEDDYFDIGDGDGGITSMCTYDDKLFIFTPDETWYAECDYSENTSAVPISSNIGCVSSGAAVATHDGIITVMATGVYKLSVSGSSKNVFTYQKISDPISDSVRASFLRAASTHYCAPRREVWLSKNNGSTDKVWIYDAEGNWFTFDGLKSHGFREVDGDVGFYYNTLIFAFQEPLYYDTDYTNGSSKEIVATWKSKPIDFGKPERRKKLLWASVSASASENVLELELTGNNGGYQSFEFTGSTSEKVNVFSCRPRIGRSHFVQVSINVGNRDKRHIFGLTLAAK